MRVTGPPTPGKRRRRLSAWSAAILASLALALAPSWAGAATTADPADPVIAAAGDIAGSWDRDEQTAALLDSIQPTAVLPLGDMAYPDGTDTDFAAFYDPTWGRWKAASMPIPGNHDYHVEDGAPYFRYFGEAAGDPAKGYYAYDLGAWRVYALNSNCGFVPCGVGSEQLAWFRADLAANQDRCMLAYWHAPRFSSHTEAGRRDNRSVAALFQAFYDASGDVILAGHNHFYERFAPLDPTGAVDPAHGVRTFVVGTGGASLYDFGTPREGSEVRDNDTHGVLEMQLHPDGYDWRFVPVAGQTFTDSGSGACAGDEAAPSAPTALRADALGSTRVGLSWTAATDDVGVTGYDVYRDGQLVGTSSGAATRYTDTTVAPGTTYTYTVAARDAAGNESARSAPSTATTDPAWARRFTAEADARVEEADPDTAHPTGSLRVDAGGDPEVQSYLRFAVSGVEGTVRSARLRVFATTGTADGPAAYAVDGGWEESALTWLSRPLAAGAPAADVGRVAANTWVDYDVTSAVTGDGTYGFALIGSTTDGVNLRQRESAQPPQLIVEGTARTFVPEADGHVEEANPLLSYPLGALRVDGGADPAMQSYLRFSVSGVDAPVRSARLRLYATTDTVNGPAVYPVDGAWSEPALTWLDRPPATGPALGDADAIGTGAWVEYDVTPAVTGDGTYSFGLIGSSADGVQFRPRESSTPPQLVVELGP